MEILSQTGGKTVELRQVPVIARLPIPERYFKDKKARKNLNLIVRETFWTIRPTNYAKNKDYFHNISLKGSKSRDSGKNLVSKKREILYNAPIDWDNKAEDFFMRGRR